MCERFRPQHKRFRWRVCVMRASAAVAAHAAAAEMGAYAAAQASARKLELESEGRGLAKEKKGGGTRHAREVCARGMCAMENIYRIRSLPYLRIPTDGSIRRARISRVQYTASIPPLSRMNIV